MGLMNPTGIAAALGTVCSHGNPHRVALEHARETFVLLPFSASGAQLVTRASASPGGLVRATAAAHLRAFKSAAVAPRPVSTGAMARTLRRFCPVWTPPRDDDRLRGW